MARRLQIYLNGISLRQAEPKALLQNISEEPQEELSWGERGGENGRRLLQKVRTGLRITVDFVIHELYDLGARGIAVDSANAWAMQGGYLETNLRPGKRIRVVPAGPAHITQGRDYTEKMQLAFEAAPEPFWEDKTPQRLALTGTQGSSEMHLFCTADLIAEAVITPAESTLNALTLSIGGKQMAFTGLNVAAGQSLIIDHDEEGNLRVMAGTVSRYACRTPASDDEFSFPPGVAAVSFTADAESTVEVRARRRWA